MPDGIDLRCSAVVVRQGAILLIHRANGTGTWALPGGTPRPGESMTACARREVREETGLTVDPARVAFVLEAASPQAHDHMGREGLDLQAGSAFRHNG